MFIHVMPGAKEEYIRYNPWRNRIIVRIKEKAIKEKANNYIIDLFSKIFLKRVTITHGKKSREKTIFIRDISKDQAIDILEDILI